MDLDHAGDPSFNDWLSQWDALQNWVSQQRFFRENLQLGEGGETGEDNRILEETFKRTGVSIMGKRMFEGGELYWPEEAPFHTPVYVLTKQVRDPWVRPGGTTFYFVNDSPEEVLKRAQEAAGGLDVRLGGGPTTINKFLAADLVDYLHVVLVPLVLGRGVPLWNGLAGLHERYAIETVTVPSGATHLFFSR